MVPSSMSGSTQHRSDAPSKETPGEEESDGTPPSTGGLRVGDVLAGKYRLCRVLGEGGMGTVWLARNELLDVDVAVKVILGELRETEAAGRLLREARAAARLDHPSIVRIFDFGESERGDPFIVMEVVEGESLRDVLERDSRIPATDAVRMVLPVLAALERAHARSVIHRDLKPDNVLLSRLDEDRVIPKVVDFGIAKLPDERDGLALTQAGVVMGSPEYLSPEQARGQTDLDHRVDLWATAVMLYELITGRRPFFGINYNALIVSIMHASPEPCTKLGAGDPELSALLERGMAKAREDRFPNARAFGRELALWLRARGVETDCSGASIASHWLGEGRGSLPSMVGAAPRSNPPAAPAPSILSTAEGDPVVETPTENPSGAGYALDATPRRAPPLLQPRAVIVAVALAVAALFLLARSLSTPEPAPTFAATALSGVALLDPAPAPRTGVVASAKDQPAPVAASGSAAGRPPPSPARPPAVPRRAKGTMPLPSDPDF
jgi:eukaryotic-like serine/threonine-protein kinase